MKNFAFLAVAVVLSAFLALTTANAQSVEQFYKGKTVELLIGYSPGGGYDTYARLLARHLGNHIPGHPTVIPKNMPGAGSLKLANFLYATAPRDGLAFGTISNGAAMDPLLGEKAAKFNAKNFNWIGSANSEVAVCVSWHTSPIKTWEDLLTKELIVGGTGPGSGVVIRPNVLSHIFGAKFKIIMGYPGTNNILLAMERGEVGGVCINWSTLKSRRQAWLKEKKLNLLMLVALKKHPDLMDVPFLMDLAKTEEQKTALRLIFARQIMGRPYVMPPEVPGERVAAMRRAFDAAMKDPALLEDARRSKLPIEPTSGPEIFELINEAYQAPKNVVELAAAATLGKK